MVKEARQARGLLIKDLVALASNGRTRTLSKTYISQVERDASMPSVEVLVSIAIALGIDVHELYALKREAMHDRLGKTLDKSFNRYMTKYK
jgi:transcriptional regulator with XRE-family HTH domain